MAPDRTKPGNRGTYVAIVLAAAVAIVAVVAWSTRGENEALPPSPAPAAVPQ